MSLLKTVSFASLLLSTTTVAQILPFEAEYAASFKGIPIATGYRQLIKLNHNVFQIKSRASALGGGFSYDDTSRFSYQQEQVQTLGFVHKQKSLFSHLQAIGHPDRKGGLIVEINGKSHHFEAPEDVKQLMDTAGFSVQLQNDLKNGLTDMNYHYNAIDEIENYRFNVIGKETINTELGEFKTLKLEQKKREGRKTWLWLAPALDYQLVKAEIIRNDKSWATLEATRITIEQSSPPEQQTAKSL
ncbi:MULTISPECIES: DUF3108 domain-containing protein [unclassified Agarivorans]|uniref:DUF3108 domain-containing protein n=1 Tax=unclassified Agarivorans TaxID=2636026 RepID=UPI003D7D5CB0